MIANQPHNEKNERPKNSFYDLPFYGACASTVISFLLHFLSFSSPYWLESYPETSNPFLRMGLWSVCFNKYIHPRDNYGFEWTGCYWIFDWNLWNRGIWEYIDPPWMIAVQVLVGVAFICHCISMVCIVFHFLLLGSRTAESSICCGTQAAAALLLLIGIIIFGVKVDDRNWMPRPDHNHLSWSYAFAVISCFTCVVSVPFLYIVYKNDKEDQDRRYGRDPSFVYGHPSMVQPPGGGAAMSAAGSVYAAGAAQPMPQHTMSMRSGYSNAPYRQY